jgi:hypothetical protein
MTNDDLGEDDDCAGEIFWGAFAFAFPPPITESCADEEAASRHSRSTTGSEPLTERGFISSNSPSANTCRRFARDDERGGVST